MRPLQRRRADRLIGESGAGTVEYVALTAILVALISLGVGAVLASGEAETRYLGSRLAMKIRCAARWPEPCWRDPLAEAYGRPVAGLVRSWASQPAPIGGFVPVDPRRCRSASCAVAADERLTTSNRRITVFSRVVDRRRRDGTLTVEYLAFRPTVGWSTDRRVATAADVASHAGSPLLESATPQIIPLETVPSVAAQAPATSGRSGTP